MDRRKSTKMSRLSQRSNLFHGDIPQQLCLISNLQIIDLAHNNFFGVIPQCLGNFSYGGYPDLSINELYGPIPGSLSSLTFLSHLNLSFINLSRKISSRNQLQTLNESLIYEGNSLLCGLPLSTKCSEDETKPRVTANGGNRKNGRGVKSFSFWISMVAGYIIAFWGVCGCTLIIKISQRQAYFRSFDNLKDKIVVFVMVKIVRLLRKVKSERN